MTDLSPTQPLSMTTPTLAYRAHIDDEPHPLIGHGLVSRPKLAEGETGTLLDLIHTHLTEHIAEIYTRAYAKKS